jgi:hypothetical protein
MKFKRWLATVQFIVSFFLSHTNRLHIKIRDTIILPIVLYVREIYCLVLRVEHRSKVCGNFFCNPILFVICTSTFSKLCKNVYSGI